MPTCCAKNCKNRSEHGVRMFLFPRNEERRNIWAERCGKNPTKNARLCEYHFDDLQFENRRLDGWRKLKPNAVPTIFESHVDPLLIEQPTSCALSNFNEDCEYEEIVAIENLPSEQQTQLVPNAVHISAVQTDDEISELKLQTTYMTSEKETTRQANQIKYLLKQLEQERAKTSAFKSKYENEKLLRLKTIKAMLRYKEHYTTLSKKLEKSPIFKHFILGLPNQKIKWSPQCLKVALQIRHAVGWKTYLYLTKDLGLPLPSYSTLCRYIAKRNFQPGTLKNVLALMAKEKEIHKSLHQNDCVILMDKTDIPALEYDVSTQVLSQHNYCKEDTIQ